MPKYARRKKSTTRKRKSYKRKGRKTIGRRRTPNRAKRGGSKFISAPRVSFAPPKRNVTFSYSKTLKVDPGGADDDTSLATKYNWIQFQLNNPQKPYQGSCNNVAITSNEQFVDEKCTLLNDFVWDETNGNQAANAGNAKKYKNCVVQSSNITFVFTPDNETIDVTSTFHTDTSNSSMFTNGYVMMCSQHACVDTNNTNPYMSWGQSTVGTRITPPVEYLTISPRTIGKFPLTQTTYGQYQLGQPSKPCKLSMSYSPKALRPYAKREDKQFTTAHGPNTVDMATFWLMPRFKPVLSGGYIHGAMPKGTLSVRIDYNCILSEVIPSITVGNLDQSNQMFAYGGTDGVRGHGDGGDL